MYIEDATCWVEASQRQEKWTCQEYLSKQTNLDAVVITFEGEAKISRHINSLEAQLSECKAGRVE